MLAIGNSDVNFHDSGRIGEGEGSGGESGTSATNGYNNGIGYGYCEGGSEEVLKSRDDC